MILPEMQGETVFILGGGPSLRGFSMEPLQDHRVIVINDSFRLAPWADCLYFCDMKWWRNRGEEAILTFTGRHIITMDNQIPGITSLRNTGTRGLETDPSGLRHGHNSGYQCINLAYHFGAKRIVLLGYDMHPTDGRLHWNTDRTERTMDFVNMLPHFITLKEPLERAGVEVINATPGSALAVWPYRSLESLLDGGDHETDRIRSPLPAVL